MTTSIGTSSLFFHIRKCGSSVIWRFYRVECVHSGLKKKSQGHIFVSFSPEKEKHLVDNTQISISFCHSDVIFSLTPRN